MAPAEVLPDPLKTPNLPYLSTEQLRRDIAADGYRKDAQVRQAVAEKLQRSALFGRDPVIAPEPTPQRKKVLSSKRRAGAMRGQTHPFWDG